MALGLNTKFYLNIQPEMNKHFNEWSNVIQYEDSHLTIRNCICSFSHLHFIVKLFTYLFIFGNFV